MPSQTLTVSSTENPRGISVVARTDCMALIPPVKPTPAGASTSSKVSQSQFCAPIDTLGDARELIATLAALKQAEGHWQDADEMLIRAAVAPSAIDDALAAMVRALKAEGLI
jgi:hypothetical protein